MIRRLLTTSIATVWAAAANAACTAAWSPRWKRRDSLPVSQIFGALGRSASAASMNHGSGGTGRDDHRRDAGDLGATGQQAEIGDVIIGVDTQGAGRRRRIDTIDGRMGVGRANDICPRLTRIVHVINERSTA